MRVNENTTTLVSAEPLGGVHVEFVPRGCQKALICPATPLQAGRLMAEAQPARRSAHKSRKKVLASSRHRSKITSNELDGKVFVNRGASKNKSRISSTGSATELEVQVHPARVAFSGRPKSGTSAATGCLNNASHGNAKEAADKGNETKQSNCPVKGELL